MVVVEKHFTLLLLVVWWEIVHLTPVIYFVAPLPTSTNQGLGVELVDRLTVEVRFRRSQDLFTASRLRSVEAGLRGRSHGSPGRCGVEY